MKATAIINPSATCFRARDAANWKHVKDTPARISASAEFQVHRRKSGKKN
jgi:hypothetical protein